MNGVRRYSNVAYECPNGVCERHGQRAYIILDVNNVAKCVRCGMSLRLAGIWPVPPSGETAK